RMPARFRKVTFGDGFVHNARFAADGETVIYSAAWEGRPAATFLKRRESAEAITLPLPPAEVQAISPRDEMALVLDPRWTHNGAYRGALATVPIFGGAPRVIEDTILHVDFSSTGAEMAVTRDVGGRGRLEWPLGHVVHESKGHLSHP